MDSYKRRKHLNRLDKERGNHLKIVKASIKTVYDEATILDVAIDEKLSIPSESQTIYTSVLRKQIIKALAVFIAFFFIVFSTISSWFPYVSRGNLPLILETFEGVIFYIIISTALALGLWIPFVIHFICTCEKSGLHQDECQFLELFVPIMILQFILSVSFGFLVVNPISHLILNNIGLSNFPANVYMHFFIITTTPFGLIFELLIAAIFFNTAWPI